MKLLELAASPLWASVTGGIFPLVGAIIGLFRAKQDQAHELATKRLELEALALKGNIDQATLAGELAKLREAGASAAFTASVEADGKVRGESRWMTNFRVGTRPALTWFYQILMTAVAAMILQGVALDRIENPILQYIIVSIVNTATMTVSWWFGQRQIDRMTVEWGNKIVNAKLSGTANR